MKKLSVITFLVLPLVLVVYSCDSDHPTDPQENRAPNEPASPHPSDNEGSVSVYTYISWNCSDPDGDPLNYDVYLGTTADPPLIENNLKTMFCMPVPLSDDTTYFWKIVARDNQGSTTEGPLWQFHTFAAPGNNPPDTPSNPTPEDGADGVGFLQVDLSWTGGDPDGDEVVYHLYWDTDSTLTNLESHLNAATYTLRNLNPLTRYYWKVIAEDEHGAASEGPVWEFMTAGCGNNNPPFQPSNPNPADGDTIAVNQYSTVTLFWIGGDPDGDPVTYFVKWDTEPSLSHEETVIIDTFLTLTGVMPNSHYFWQVKAQDPWGATSTGPVWEFYTTEIVSLDFDELVIAGYTGQAGYSDPLVYTSIYLQARAAAWSDYLSDVPRDWDPGPAAVVGQWSLVSTEWDDFDHEYDTYVGHGGYVARCSYTLDSKGSATEAKVRFLRGGETIPDFVFIPFFMEVFIDNVKVGELYIDEPGSGIPYLMEVPIDIDLVKTGTNISFEIRTDRFKQANPVPEEPFLGEVMYLEYIFFASVELILE